MTPSVVLLGNLLAGLSVDACLHRAVVTASLVVEGWGPDALLAAMGVEANARLRQRYGSEVAR